MLEDVRAIGKRAGGSQRPGTNDTARLRVLAQQKHIVPKLKRGQEQLFRSLWADNIPVIVEDVMAKMQRTWSPEDFIQSHGHERVKMTKMVKPNPVTVSVTVSEFFLQFFNDDNSRNYAVKVKASTTLRLWRQPNADHRTVTTWCGPFYLRTLLRTGLRLLRLKLTSRTTTRPSWMPFLFLLTLATMDSKPRCSLAGRRTRCS